MEKKEVRGVKGRMKRGKMKTGRGRWREKRKYGGIKELNRKKKENIKRHESITN